MNECQLNLKHGKNISITIIGKNTSDVKFYIYWFTYLQCGSLMQRTIY